MHPTPFPPPYPTQVKAKDKRINQLEEAKYRLEEENAAMARKLEELQRKDALSRAKSPKGTCVCPPRLRMLMS